MPKLNKRRCLGRAYARKQCYDQRISPENETLSEKEEIAQDNNNDTELVHFADTMKTDGIRDLFEIIEDKIDLKIVTALLYMILHHFGISWVICDDFFELIGALTIEIASKWADIFSSGSFDELISKDRGGSIFSIFTMCFLILNCPLKIIRFSDMLRKQLISTHLN